MPAPADVRRPTGSGCVYVRVAYLEIRGGENEIEVSDLHHVLRGINGAVTTRLGGRLSSLINAVTDGS